MKHLLICLFLCLSFSLAQSFPTLTGSTLNDVEVSYPDDFSKPYTLVIMPLQQEHQDTFTTWESYLKNLQTQNPNFSFVQILPIGNMNFLLKGIISSAMKNAYDDTVKAQTVPLFEEVEPILEAFQIEDDSQMYIYLVSDNKIIWENTGPFSLDKAKLLEQQLVSVR